MDMMCYLCIFYKNDVLLFTPGIQWEANSWQVKSPFQAEQSYSVDAQYRNRIFSKHVALFPFPQQHTLPQQIRQSRYFGDKIFIQNSTYHLAVLWQETTKELNIFKIHASVLNQNEKNIENF